MVSGGSNCHHPLCARIEHPFFVEARKFVTALGSEVVDVVIDDARVVEMPPDFIETASTIGVVAYPGVRRVAFCNIPPGWKLTLEAANKLATGKTDRVTFHPDVASAFGHLKKLQQVVVSADPTSTTPEQGSLVPAAGVGH